MTGEYGLGTTGQTHFVIWCIRPISMAVCVQNKRIQNSREDRSVDKAIAEQVRNLALMIGSLEYA